MNEKQFSPEWREKAPKKGTYRSIFKWGSPNDFKHPNLQLFALLKKTLELKDEDFKERQNEGDELVQVNQIIGLSDEQIRGFQNIVGEENVTTDEYTRVKYAQGKTTEEALKLRQGIVDGVADLVVHPRNRDDVMKIMQFCDEQRIPMYPYGGGSSVTFGCQCVKGGISLVMSTHMNRVLGFNEKNQSITVEPGILGPALEDALNQAPSRFNASRRYTCGHFPQSFEFSSVGGWISTLGSGQQSSYYGDAYDIVLSQEYITPRGPLKMFDYAATATGPKVNDIMKGSEGAFGVLVSATLKVFRYTPETRKRFSYIFPSWEAAVDAAREISQGEFGMPSVFRISDPEETDVGLKLFGVEGTIIDRMMRLRGFNPMKRCLYIGSADGERGFSKNVRKRVNKICKNLGAMSLTGYVTKKWEHGRYLDPYMREDANDYGIVIDTLECSVSWDNLHSIHQGVRNFIKERPNTMCMTHASHFYPQGTNLYFVFIGKFKNIMKYKGFQEGIINRIHELGGSLSHHHGVGKMIGPWMESHLGKDQMDVLRSLKEHFDPKNIMNPGGTLGLDLPAIVEHTK